MPVIGILGGVGSGKSSVVRHVSGLKLHIIDADRIGHEQLSDPKIQSEIRRHFGDHVFAPDGSVDRSRMAKHVFGETRKHHAARKQLNNIIHPAIRRVIHSEIDSASRDVDAVILDAALLLEGGWDATCNWLIFVDTPLPIRQQRVLENRGWSAEELARREATQIHVDEKKARADFVVDNSKSISEAASEMKQILDSVLTRQTP
ncbi:MAG: dephospho-CoA kinase [Planctomycetaceae bacterium]